MASASPQTMRNITNSFNRFPSSSTSSGACSSSSSLTSQANLLINLGGLMNRYPAGLPSLNAWRASSSSSQSQPKNINATRNGGQAGTGGKRMGRTPLRIPHSNRRAPPPPVSPPAQEEVFDPTRTIILPPTHHLTHQPPRIRRDSLAPPRMPTSYRSPAPVPRPPSSPSTFNPFGVGVPSAYVASDRDAKAKLVAELLLNRIHSSKPMRRRVLGGKPKPYVRSNLSCIITLDC